MKKYILIALGASFLMACTAVKEEPTIKTSNPDEVSFSAYLNRSTTKAGAVGGLNTSGLQTAGFGVFGYHTDNALYSQAALPNFMYNTKVSTASWTYSPIKYWPNEFGGDASSEAVDRLTFFAYAPWVKVNSATGALDGTEYDNTTPEKSTTTGITRLSRATDTGDPLVSYVVSFDPAKTVDLTWGVAKEAFNKSAGSTEGTNAIAQGDPYINVARPNTGDKIAFGFEHALASLNVQIKSTLAGGAAHDAAQTKVYVRSVTFEGFSGEGSLNLNSKKGAPQWVNYYGNGALSTESVTIYDGRRDGREATSADANEKPSDLNPVIIQSAAYAATPTDGVTGTAVNLFNGAAATSPVYVIPTGDQLKVTIAYDVETIDDKILGTYLADGATHGSVVENTITKTITGITSLEAGKKYVITLNLGLNSVDFDAEIVDWGDGESANSNLPKGSILTSLSLTSGGTAFPTSIYMSPGETSGTSVSLGTSVADDPITKADPVVPTSSDIDWTLESSNPSVATIDDSGSITAVAVGEAVITLTASYGGATISQEYNVYVNPTITNVSLAVTPEYYVVEVEDENVAIFDAGANHAATITATLTFEGGAPAQVYGTPVVFTSDNDEAVTVTFKEISEGKYIAIATGVADGEATITASAGTVSPVTATHKTQCMVTKVVLRDGNKKFGSEGYELGGYLCKDSEGNYSLNSDFLSLIGNTFCSAAYHPSGAPITCFNFYEVEGVTVDGYYVPSGMLDWDNITCSWQGNESFFHCRLPDTDLISSVIFANVDFGDKVLEDLAIIRPYGAEVYCADFARKGYGTSPLQIDYSSLTVPPYTRYNELTYDQLEILLEGGCIALPAVGFYNGAESQWKSGFGAYGSSDGWGPDAEYPDDDDCWSVFAWWHGEKTSNGYNDITPRDSREMFWDYIMQYYSSAPYNWEGGVRERLYMPFVLVKK